MSFILHASAAVATLARLIFFMVGWVIGPFPWSIISKHIVSDGEYGSRLDFAADTLVSAGFVANAIIVVFVMGSGGGVSSEPWELAYLGWAMGMGALRFWLGRVRRAGNMHGGPAEAERRGNAYRRALLRPFGAKVVAEGKSWQWSYCLLALLSAQAAFFLADWFLADSNPALNCSDPPKQTLASCQEHGILAFVLDAAGRCCVVEDATFSPREMLGSLGGNIVSGFAFVKVMAKWLIWSDKHVLLAHDALPLSAGQHARRRSVIGQFTPYIRKAYMSRRRGSSLEVSRKQLHDQQQQLPALTEDKQLAAVSKDGVALSRNPVLSNHSSV